MKTRFLTGLLGLLITFSTSAQRITVEGTTMPGTHEVRLMAFNGESLGYDQQQLVKTKEGRFEISWAFDQPNLYKLIAGEQEVRLAISESAIITVTFKESGSEVKGSAESLSMIEFEKRNGELQARHFGALKKEADEAMAKGDKAALQKIQEKSAVAIQAFLVDFRKAIEDMGVGPAGYYALQFSDFTKEIDYITSRLEVFQAQIPNSPVTKALEKQVYRSRVVAIGAVPPAINATDKSGKAFSLDQYVGKVLLVDFWAAWCRACRIENPQFVELYERYHDKGFEVVSISQDEDSKTWEAAIAKDGVGIWRQVQDADGSISELYSVSSLPQNVVIGRDGKIIAKNVTAKALEKLLAAQL